MVSGIVSRECGFGLKLSHEDLQKVNQYRENKEYSDVLAATNKRGTVNKQPLKSPPFVVEFKYGANAEGYWTYNHIVLKLKDCIDVVKVLYLDYNNIFLFYLHKYAIKNPSCINLGIRGI